jgi:hypothetical protein
MEKLTHATQSRTFSTIRYQIIPNISIVTILEMHSRRPVQTSETSNGARHNFSLWQRKEGYNIRYIVGRFQDIRNNRVQGPDFVGCMDYLVCRLVSQPILQCIPRGVIFSAPPPVVG